VGRGEMPSEPGDSWFSPKCLEGQPAGGPAGVARWCGEGATAYRPTSNGEDRGARPGGVRRRVRRFVAGRGVKQILKPRAYEPSGRYTAGRPAGRVTACLLKNEPASSPARRVKGLAPRSRSESECERAFVASGRPETG